MKNIEVLLNDLDEAYYDLGTRTGEPIEACSKWKDAHKEILSRFAEKDKRIAELEKLPQIKYIYGLITKIAELEKQVADLRCCGNCVHYAYDMEEDHHYCDKHIYSGLRHQGICTNNWQSDNKTKAEREK